MSQVTDTGRLRALKHEHEVNGGPRPPKRWQQRALRIFTALLALPMLIFGIWNIATQEDVSDGIGITLIGVFLAIMSVPTYRLTKKTA